MCVREIKGWHTWSESHAAAIHCIAASGLEVEQGRLELHDHIVLLPLAEFDSRSLLRRAVASAAIRVQCMHLVYVEEVRCHIRHDLLVAAVGIVAHLDFISAVTKGFEILIQKHSKEHTHDKWQNSQRI